ncbi:MAG: fibronectin type III domain-containing protein, partial [Panacibacter sp.]
GNVSGGHGYSDCWIAKLNRLGSIEWQKPYGGSNDERPYSIKQTLEGGFVFAGFSTSEDGDVTGYHKAPYTNDYWVVKLDVSGNLVWQKCLGGFSNDESRSIQQTSDTGYIVAGFANSVNGDVTGHHGSAYISDCWIVKLGRPNPIPVIASVTDITSSNAVAHWYPFLNASSYLVRRYVAGTTGYKYNLPVADTLKTIINLMPSTQYYVQVKAIFGINDSSDWSFPYSLITASGCKPPENLQVTRTADSLAKLEWTMPASPVKWFHLRYKPSRISAWIEKKINGNTNYILLHGLSPGTTYKWQVRSLCIADWSQWVDGPNFITAPALLIALTKTNNVVDK